MANDEVKVLNDQEAESVSGGGANGPSWVDGGATYYRVVRGDTLSEIAVRFGTSIWNIQALNRDVIKNVDLIREGWVIRVK